MYIAGHNNKEGCSRNNSMYIAGIIRKGVAGCIDRGVHGYVHAHWDPSVYVVCVGLWLKIEYKGTR